MKGNALRYDQLRGVFTALITPMLSGTGGIDWPKLKRLIDDQIAAGVTGVLACGTTGQSATLGHDEHIEVAVAIYEYVNGRVPVIFSAGSNSTAEALSLTLGIQERVGPATFLHVTGYYNNPPQEGLIAHFEHLADIIHEDSNIVLYSVPGRTVSNIEAATVIRLAQHPRIIGIKEASGNVVQVHEIIQGTRDQKFTVMSGEDHIVSLLMRLGAQGVISASANIAPLPFVQLTKAALEGEFDEAHRIQEWINPLVKKGVFKPKTKNPTALAHVFGTDLRLPMILLPYIMKELWDVLIAYTPEELGIDYRSYQEIT